MRGCLLPDICLALWHADKLQVLFSKGIRSGNGRASIPHVLSGVISLLLGAGTLNCGFSLWPESPHIGQRGHVGVSQGDPVDAELSADAGST